MTHYSWEKTTTFSDLSSIQTNSPLASFAPLTVVASASTGTTLTVGAGQEFSSLAAAVAAAQNGDTVLVQAGTYTNDFADVTTNITIKGVGGIANFVATEAPSNLKGILTVDNSCTIENCSFSGAAISEADGGNAAGIRYEGGAMVLENDTFSNNQNGVMGTPTVPGLTDNTIAINRCTFTNNGAGDGVTHNCYIGTVTSLVFTNNISQGADAGHELKSRAYSNTIDNNVFQDGPTGQASYEIDLPDGGADTIENNTLEKGPLAENEVFVHFGGEGIPYAGSSLLLEGNDFINNYGAGAIAVLNQTPYSVTITGNEFTNIPVGNIASGPAVETSNTDGRGDPLPNTTLTGVLPGDTVIFTDDAPHTISLAGTILAVEGGGGLLTATAVAGHIIAMGGAGGMDYAETGTSGGNTVTTAAGSTNTLTLIGQDLISSAGTDTITCGACNVTGQVTGTATIYDGTGNDTWDIMGTARIVGDGSNPVVSIGTGASASITGPLNYLYVQNNGGNFALSIGQAGVTDSMSDTGGAVTDTVADGTMTVATAAGPVGATLTLGAGTAYVTSAGTDTIYAGSGADTVILESAATVYAASGSLSIYGRSDPGGANVYGNGGTYLFAGDTGNITYHGGALASTVNDQLSNITLLGGAGRMTVLGGSDNYITGGTGGVTYKATDGGGANQITTQAGATDTLALAGSDLVNSYGNDSITEGGGNQVLNVYGTSTIHGGAGSNLITFGGDDTLFGVGQDYVTVLAGATAHINAGRNTVVNETGAAMVHIIEGSPLQAEAVVYGGSAQIQAGTSTPGSIAISTSDGTRTLVELKSGTDSVISNGTDTIYGGTGRDTIGINDAPVKIVGGAGTLSITNQDGSLSDTQTVFGSTGALTYIQSGGTLNFIGGAGAASIDGGAGALYITGGSGSLSVTGGSSGLHFLAGTGAASVDLTSGGGVVEFGAGTTNVQEAGWGAADIFRFVAGHGGGTDTITGFRAGTDKLAFVGVHVASETISGGSTTLSLTDHTALLLAGFADTGHMF
jgi:hypothetical protein